MEGVSPALEPRPAGGSPRRRYIDWLRVLAVLCAFYLVGMPGPGWLEWLALLAAAVAGTSALYEVVRRVGPLRFLFGMRRATAA